MAVPPPPAFLSATPTGRRTDAGAKRWWVAGGVAAAVAVAAGVAVALTAGGDEPAGEDFLALEPKAVVEAAEKDMAVVRNARIRGEFTDDAGDTITVDVTATTSGDCRGTLTSAASGGTGEILRVDDDVYLRADREFWNASGDPETTTLILAVLGDKWVVENSLLESTEAFCDLDEFLERDGREDADARALGSGEVDGEETVRIEQTEGTDREVLDVRVAEPHYLVGVEEGSEGEDRFRFSDFDSDVDIQAPADGDVFPLQTYLDTIAKGLDALPGADEPPSGDATE